MFHSCFSKLQGPEQDDSSFSRLRVDLIVSSLVLAVVVYEVFTAVCFWLFWGRDWSLIHCFVLVFFFVLFFIMTSVYSLDKELPCLFLS